jgi:hypothetical protein
MITTVKPSYTIQNFINAVTAVNNKTLMSNGVYNVVAPRFGESSVKAETLDFFLNGNTNAILDGTGTFASLGKTPRARLLKALRLRQTNGFII